MNKSGKKIKSYGVIVFFVCILLIRTIYFLCYQKGYLYADSYGYLEFDFKALINLDFTNGRTPIYPLILKVMVFLFGDNGFGLATVIFQTIFSYISVIYLFKIINLLTTHNWISYMLTFIYGTSTMICGWDFAILTESLALSGTIFFIYYVFMFMKYDESKYGIISNIILFILIFLRPTFLLFNVILLVFLIIRLIFKKKNTLKVFGICIISWVFIFIYSACFYSSQGIFTISDPMPRQLMVICIERGYYKNSDNMEFVNLVENGLAETNNDIWATMWPVLGYYGQSETQKIAKECIKNNFIQYIKDEIKITAQTLQSDFYAYSVDLEDIDIRICTTRNIWDKITNIIKPIHGILLGVWLLIITITNLIKKKKLCWIASGLGIFIFGIFTSTMIATCGEYIRTMIHIIPFIFISISYVCAKYLYDEDYFIDGI